MMTEKVLVTGGAGFIGSHLVDALVSRGYQVRILDNLDPQVHGDIRSKGLWPEYCNPAAEYLFGDVRDGETVKHALQDIAIIYHQAAVVGVGQSMYQIERYVDANSRGTAVLLDAIVGDENYRSNIKKVIVASSMSIYGEGAYECLEHGKIYPHERSEEQLEAGEWEPRCPTCDRMLNSVPTPEEKPLIPTSVYAITKKDQEELTLTTCSAYQIPAVALRYFNTYGERQALSNPYTGVAAIFSNQLLNGKAPLIFEDGNQSRDFVHVSDVVQANLIALERDEMNNQVFNVGTGKKVTIAHVSELLTRHLGLTIEPKITSRFRAGDIRHCYADNDKLVAHGFEPRVDFSQGIGQLVNWIQDQNTSNTFDQSLNELEQRGLTT
jgi:dTDP-L-rhamnose 4-epimerase